MLFVSVLNYFIVLDFLVVCIYDLKLYCYKVVCDGCCDWEKEIK